MINSENDGLGFININAHKKCRSIHGATNFYKDNTFSYCCFGDPSLCVWTDSILIFPTPTIELASNTINISIENISDYEKILYGFKLDAELQNCLEQSNKSKSLSKELFTILDL